MINEARDSHPECTSPRLHSCVGLFGRAVELCKVIVLLHFIGVEELISYLLIELNAPSDSSPMLGSEFDPISCALILSSDSAIISESCAKQMCKSVECEKVRTLAKLS